MIDRDTRSTILLLRNKGQSLKAIEEVLGVSRNTLRRVLESGQPDVPGLDRHQLAEPHDAHIRALFLECGGNLVRVREKLADAGVRLAYSTLTGFCRRRGIGVEPPQIVGKYTFAPGQEMQHDTSPHKVKLGGVVTLLQCANLVLCFSRCQYAQVYRVWNRFWAKVFLSEALVALGGAAGQCMLDNSSVLVVRGTGKDAVMAPEMVALGDRFGFRFAAHKLGDANRSARVERPFHYIENNFYPGRTFADLDDLNAQLRTWCKEREAMPKRALGGARPMDLFVTEAAALRPLPIHIPEPYRIHLRKVDDEGYLNLHNNRYSCTTTLIGHEVSVHEKKDRLEVYRGHKLLFQHVRAQDNGRHCSILDEHREEHKRRRRELKAPSLSPEELAMRASSESLAAMIDALKKRHAGRATRSLQHLRRMWIDYPNESMDQALCRALEHGLFDLVRIERMILEHIAGDFFRLPKHDEELDPDHE